MGAKLSMLDEAGSFRPDHRMWWVGHEGVTEIEMLGDGRFRIAYDDGRVEVVRIRGQYRAAGF